MGQIFNGLSADINVSGIGGIPTNSQTLKEVYHTANGSLQTAYTCPANKKAYLMAVSCYYTANWAGQISYNDGSAHTIFDFANSANISHSFCPSCAMVELEETHTITVNGTNGSRWTLIIVEVAV